MIYYDLWPIFPHPKIDALFLFFGLFLKISKSEFLIQDLMSRLIVNGNGILIYQFEC